MKENNDTVFSSATEFSVLRVKMHGNKIIWKALFKDAANLGDKEYAYKFFKMIEAGEKKIALAHLCFNYTAVLVKYAKKVYNCYGCELNEKKFLKSVYVLENPLFEGVFRAQYNDCALIGVNLISWKDALAMGMKFDLVVTNPPYAGKGDPLFMKIAKTIYDNCLSDKGKLVVIAPTSLVDNTYNGKDSHSASLIKKYSGMKVCEFMYENEYRTAFDANIGTGICITTYSKDGKWNLFSDEVKEIRFGKENWDMRKSIVAKTLDKKMVADYDGFYRLFAGNEEARDVLVKEANKTILNKSVVVLAYNHGHVSDDGGHKWDWVALQSQDQLKVQTQIVNSCQYIIPISKKVMAKNLIKWFVTDAVGYLVLHYKTAMPNNEVLFHLLPQPPALDGNYSDEVLMSHFGWTKEQMKHIHETMKNYGWKVKFGKTESELMDYIDEINK